LTGYQHLEEEQQTIAPSQKHHSFQSGKEHVGLKQLFVHSKSAIQSAIIPGENVTSIAQKLQEKDLM
jgi:8-amino-7-oxononanoate synthase